MNLRWRTVQWMMLAGAVSLAGAAGGEAPSSQPRQIAGGEASGAWTATAVDLLGGDRPSTQRLRVMSAGRMVVVVVDKPEAIVHWQFGYQDTVITAGEVRLDMDGVGLIKLAIPEVRARLECSLLLTGQSHRARRQLVIYPPSRLKMAVGRLTQLRIGVLDPHGRMQRHLTAADVPYDDLRTSLALRAFDGELLIVADQQADVSGEIVQSLEDRLKGGMAVLWLNPPAGKGQWGFRGVTEDPPISQPVELADGMNQSIRADDLGAGPWPVTLRASGKGTPLMWLVDENEGGDRRERLLVVAMPVEKGMVVAASMGQLSDPSRNVVGGLVVDEILLWFLREHFDNSRTEEMQS